MGCSAPPKIVPRMPEPQGTHIVSTCVPTVYTFLFKRDRVLAKSDSSHQLSRAPFLGRIKQMGMCTRFKNGRSARVALCAHPTHAQLTGQNVINEGTIIEMQ
jgi:hypothetical protein